MQKVDLPEETGSYDHWGMKLGKKNRPAGQWNGLT
jgi:hypothetical protein